MAKFPTTKGPSRARDLDLDPGSGHTAYHHASLDDLYLHTKFHRNRTNFLWTDGRYGNCWHQVETVAGRDDRCI